MIISPKKLRAYGVLGINQRNADFIMRYNDRSRYPLVDDKLETKKLARAHGIAVPDLYETIETEREIEDVIERLKGYPGFVIKPANGSGGNGVLVVSEHRGKHFLRSSGDLMMPSQLHHYVSNILSGMYSLGGVPDKAMVEYLVRFDPAFDGISYRGVPDIRVIVFKGIPVAAMLRLPTRSSDGKANLHQGALGVGIYLDTGRTGLGISQDRLFDVHPDTGHSIRDVEIPHWQKILELSTQCADIVQMGYIGVDIVLDKNLGPLVLELNARPGLNVQLACGRGLMLNLERVESLVEPPQSIEQRVAYCQNSLCVD